MGQRTTRDQKNIRTAWVERIKKDMFVALERTDVDGPTKTAMPYKICEVIDNKKSNGQDKDFENNKIKINKSFVVVKVYVVKNEKSSIRSDQMVRQQITRLMIYGIQKE